MGSWWISLLISGKRKFLFFFLSLPVSYFLACICTLSIYLYWTFPSPSCITINLFTLNMIHPIPQITPKHSEHITSATSTHVHCLAYTQAKDFFFFIIPLSCWFLAFAIYFFIFLHHWEPQKEIMAFFFFSETFSTHSLNMSLQTYHPLKAHVQ